jgi:uncharacterized protein (TIGR00375 family)
MQFIADLHIHSHFSRATSKLLIPEQLSYWAGIKGIKVVGTGDFTHPGWLAELKEKLEPDGNALFWLKKEFRLKPLMEENETRFLLTAEISNIYKRDGKVRKVHNVVLVPGFEEAEKINRKLVNLGGNLKSDGRPILGLDSRDLLEIVLECSEDNFFIPAHIWTPWFSMLGSKSGFDSAEECFGDLTKHVYAVETGLSTDAPMNWLCSFLDGYTLVSNSDAHSPDRLGRNANVFDSELSYQGITQALKPGNKSFLGTIDLYPQEGKYHFDGHRKCNICWSPVETLQHNSVCPVCGKPDTVGVMNRVVQLSDREDISERINRLPFRSIIPLPEILAEIAGVGESSKQVQEAYEKTVLKLGNELEILLNIPIETIEAKTSKTLAEAIRRMRNREVIVSEGYDGEYGRIRVFNPGEIQKFTAGHGLFSYEGKITSPRKRALIEFDLGGIQDLKKNAQDVSLVAEGIPSYRQAADENQEQQTAIEYNEGVSMILAGPGTGKTRTLTEKIFYLIKKGLAQPDQILAITFTNKAAGEMKSRLARLLGELKVMPFVSTFHGFGKFVLEENSAIAGRSDHIVLVDENDHLALLTSIDGVKANQVKALAAKISQAKQNFGEELETEAEAVFGEYEKLLARMNAFDFDDLIRKPVDLLKKHPEILVKYREKFRFLFVDEFQDTNPLQFELIKLLSGNTDSQSVLPPIAIGALSSSPTGVLRTVLCVVGDPNQSIYRFRGSSLISTDSFVKEFPGAKIFRLRTSYRCSQNILNASSNVLEEGGSFLEGLDQGLKITISPQPTDKSEAEFIAREIVELAGGLSFFSIDSGVAEGHKHEFIESLSDFAVLCRTKHQFKTIEKAFANHNIPVQVVGEMPFFNEKPLSNLLELYFASISETKSYYSEWLLRSKNLIEKAKIENIRDEVAQLPVKEGLKKIREIFFEVEPGEFRRLLDWAESFATPAEFQAAVKTGNVSDTYIDKLEAVSLMTLHASKGLEFECVFIAGCEQGLLPYNLYTNEVDTAEESRLMYVGMTRAKKILYLSHAATRNFRNRILSLQRSSFLDKIEKELVEKVRSVSRKKPDDGKQLDLF